MKFICPLLVVDDIQRSRHFYETILGLKVTADFGENITFIGKFAIHAKNHFGNLIKKNVKSGENNIELYFEVEDVEKIYAELKKNNIDFVHELIEQPWKQKVFRIYDPDNYIIEFGESMVSVVLRLHSEGLELEKISTITFFDIETVKRIIDENN